MSGGDGYWRSTPIPPPPGFPNRPIFWAPPPPGFQNPPVFWSPPPPPAPPFYYGSTPPSAILRPHFPPPSVRPQQLAFHYFVDTERPAPAPASAPPATSRRTCPPSPRSPPSQGNAAAAAPVVGLKRPRGRPPGTGWRQKKALQRSSKRPPSSVSALKAPCAGDSTVSSSNVPLNVLKTKLSKIKNANREDLEKTASKGESEKSSKTPLSMIISKMIREREGKRKAQLENSAFGATMDMARENSLKDISTTSLPQDIHEEEIQAQAFVDQLRTEGTKGKSVVEQAQQANLTGQTEKEVPNGGNHPEVPTETDDIVAEIMQRNPQLSETASMGVLLADTNEMAARPKLDEITDENMTDQEVDRRERRPSRPDCQSRSSVEVGQYSVHPSLSPIMEAIINKYGDIVKDSICESNSARSSILESICRVYQGLQVPAKHLKPLDFNNYFMTVKNADKMGVKVKWLLDRFDKHLDTARLAGKCKDMRDGMKKNMELRDSTKKAAEQKKDEIKELKLEIQELENRLSSLNTSEIKMLKSDMAASKYKLFRTKGLTEGLF